MAVGFLACKIGGALLMRGLVRMGVYQSPFVLLLHLTFAHPLFVQVTQRIENFVDVSLEELNEPAAFGGGTGKGDRFGQFISESP